RWDREAQHARDLGTMMHDKIEHYYLGEDQGDGHKGMVLSGLLPAKPPVRSDLWFSLTDKQRDFVSPAKL
ncbi:hypothetical protein, partial [Duncaniella muris]|uniref:hypothetical protein n=1 Tax=Duncaniella muris TaxID=2094150 RepID=UPI00272A35AD